MYRKENIQFWLREKIQKSQKTEFSQRRYQKPPEIICIGIVDESFSSNFENNDVVFKSAIEYDSPAMNHYKNEGEHSVFFVDKELVNKKNFNLFLPVLLLFNYGPRAVMWITDNKEEDIKRINSEHLRLFNIFSNKFYGKYVILLVCKRSYQIQDSSSIINVVGMNVIFNKILRSVSENYKFSFLESDNLFLSATAEQMLTNFKDKATLHNLQSRLIEDWLSESKLIEKIKEIYTYKHKIIVVRNGNFNQTKFIETYKNLFNFNFDIKITTEKDFNFLDNSLDCVVLDNSLRSMLIPGEFLNSIYKSLKKTGKLIVSDCNINSNIDIDICNIVDNLILSMFNNKFPNSVEYLSFIEYPEIDIWQYQMFFSRSFILESKLISSAKIFTNHNISVFIKVSNDFDNTKFWFPFPDSSLSVCLNTDPHYENGITIKFIKCPLPCVEKLREKPTESYINSFSPSEWNSLKNFISEFNDKTEAEIVNLDAVFNFVESENTNNNYNIYSSIVTTGLREFFKRKSTKFKFLSMDDAENQELSICLYLENNNFKILDKFFEIIMSKKSKKNIIIRLDKEGLNNEDFINLIAFYVNGSKESYLFKPLASYSDSIDRYIILIGFNGSKYLDNTIIANSNFTKWFAKENEKIDKGFFFPWKDKNPFLDYRKLLILWNYSFRINSVIKYEIEAVSKIEELKDFDYQIPQFNKIKDFVKNKEKDQKIEVVQGSGYIEKLEVELREKSSFKKEEHKEPVLILTINNNELLISGKTFSFLNFDTEIKEKGYFSTKSEKRIVVFKINKNESSENINKVLILMLKMLKMYYSTKIYAVGINSSFFYPAFSFIESVKY